MSKVWSELETVQSRLYPTGSQRYRCRECSRVYTSKPAQHGYSEDTRLLAIRMYVKGSSYGSIGRVQYSEVM